MTLLGTIGIIILGAVLLAWFVEYWQEIYGFVILMVLILLCLQIGMFLDGIRI